MKWNDNFFKSTELTETGMLKSTQLKTGVKIEKEHKDLIAKIRKDIAKDGKLDMSDEQVYKIIAKGHIKEDKNYYTKLLKYIEKENHK